MNPFPCQLAHTIHATTEATRWLIDGLWGYDAVGILGGEPKCCKSLCALTLAVAVASGTPCLDGRQPKRTGTVLLFAAEDDLSIVRDRLDRLCRGLGCQLEELPIQVITNPTLRLDRDEDRSRLELTIAQHKPVLVILDPFVRLHRIDENVAGEVAPLLDHLRRLQRTYGCAILLVHHARKAAGHIRSGQALRGSSELHAWGDSNLFLRRQDEQLTLDIEHRAAQAPNPIRLRLDTDHDLLRLQPDHPQQAPQELNQRILTLLATAEQPMSRQQIRAALHLRNATLVTALEQLRHQQRIQRNHDNRWSIAA
jgi:RecA-family ATPase